MLRKLDWLDDDLVLRDLRILGGIVAGRCRYLLTVPLRRQMLSQEAHELCAIADASFIVAGDLPVCSARQRLEDDVERQRLVIELGALEIQVPMSILHLLAYRELVAPLWRVQLLRDLIGVQRDQLVLLKQLFDVRLGEHIAFVQLAVSANDAGEINKDSLALEVGVSESFLQIADPGQVALLLVGKKERIQPREHRPAGALVESFLLEEGGSQIERQAQKSDRKQHAGHAKTLLRRIVRQPKYAKQIKSARETQRHVQAQHKIIRQQHGLRGYHQLAGAEEFQRRRQLEKAHDHLHGVEPGAAFRQPPEQGRKESEDEER